MKTKTVILLAAFCAVLSVPAHGEGWQTQPKTDAFTGNSYAEFVLVGRFLTAPRQSTLSAPRLIMHCLPGEKKFAGKWYSAGQFIKAYVDTGAVLNHSEGEIPVMFRRDDGKSQSDSWGISTDGAALFISATQADEIFYGHFMPHKPNTSPAVTKLVLMADEYLGAGVVMQFDLTGIDEVAGQCGLAIYEKK